MPKDGRLDWEWCQVGLACFLHFIRCGDSFELLVAGGNTVLSKFSLFLLFSGLQAWLGLNNPFTDWLVLLTFGGWSRKPVE